MQWANRTEAGLQLASRLKEYAGEEDLVTLGLVRGGVLVAAAVAEELGSPLEVFVVRKVGVPGHEELAMGAVASGDVTVRNEEVLARLNVPSAVFQESVETQRREVTRREALYRQDRPATALQDRIVILTDDGLATGASMRAAVEAVRKVQPRRLVAAVPVAARVTADEFRRLLSGPDEEFVCLHEAEALDGVGRWYDDFRQIEDEEVQQLLQIAAQRGAAVVRQSL